MARPTLNAPRQWLRILATIPALVAIFGFGQAVLDQRAWRLDLTPHRRYTLSPHAQQMLGSLDADVRVLAFLRSQDPRNSLIEDLLRQIQSVTPRITVEMLDVNRSPALARQYGVEAYGALVVASGGRHRVFANPREEVLIAAIRDVTRPGRRPVAWSVGHGEGDLAATDRRLGYSLARTALEHASVELRPVSLLGADVPDDVALLAIVGPEKDFLPEELEALDRFVQRGRSILVALAPGRAPRLAQHLARYGVLVGDDVVVDPASRLFGGEQITIQVSADRGTHPLSAALGAGPLFSFSRSVGLQPGASGTALLWSSAQGWASRDPNAARTAAVGFDPSRDRRGPISVGVEVMVPPAAPGGDAGLLTQLVVLGNADFASNFFLEFLGNRDLLLNAVSWLVRDRESLAERAASRVAGVEQFFLSEEEGARVFWATAVLQPAILLAIGLGFVARRWWG